MNRIGALLSCALLAGACGADSAPKSPAPVPVAETQTGEAQIELPAEVTGIALHRGDTREDVQLFASAGDFYALPNLGEALVRIAGAVETPRHVDVQDNTLWIAGIDQLASMDADTHALRSTGFLDVDAEIGAIEIGFDGSIFVADAHTGRIYIHRKTRSEVLVEGATFANPSALLLNGGSLIVGTADGVHSVDLTSREHKRLSSGSDQVVGLALDHLGYVIVARASGELEQLRPDGSRKSLQSLEQPISSIAFDDTTRTLYVASGKEIDRVDYLQRTGEDQALWSRRDARVMRPFSQNGMTLSGGEYWPSHGTINVSYPDDILWGFYPSPDEVIEGGASQMAPPVVAVQCAEQSFAALQAFFESNPPEFHRVAEAIGASKRFYLWINDYSDAAKDFPHEQRMNKFWYWERKPAVVGRVPGFWKWETTLLQDGTCLWPKAEQIRAYLSEKLAAAK